MAQIRSTNIVYHTVFKNGLNIHNKIHNIFFCDKEHYDASLRTPFVDFHWENIYRIC